MEGINTSTNQTGMEQTTVQDMEQPSVMLDKTTVSEDFGNIRLSVDLAKVTPREAEILELAVSQLREDGTVPPGSIAARAQAATNENEPEADVRPKRDPATVDNNRRAREAIGNIHIEADLSKLTPKEVSVLQSIESRLEPKAPKDGIAALAMRGSDASHKTNPGSAGTEHGADVITQTGGYRRE